MGRERSSAALGPRCAKFSANGRSRSARFPNLPMRRSLRARAAGALVLCFCLLQVIAAFEWPVTVERRLAETELSAPPSKCPHTFRPHVVVVAGTRHDPTWAGRLGESVEYLVYQQDDPGKPNYYPGDGNEVGAYLQFILDYYDCLPNVTAFVHGHQAEGWHNHDMHWTMSTLQWNKIPGYTDLNRKMPIWDIQLRDRPKYPASPPIATGAEVYSGDYHPMTIMGGNAYDPEDTFHFLQREANVRAFDKFFGRAGLGALPHRITFICCSQFAVTADRIRLRSREFWAQNMHYMCNNDLQGNHMRPKHHVVGDVWTIYWPMIFGEPAEYDRRISDEELFSG